MSRPLRIQFKNAYYHVMNRGAGRAVVFTNDAQRTLFLELLREAHEMFRAEIHAYCLMGNHYHLLMSTPDGNLQRIMRHINGVYTQRYNRLEQTDGPLFRGRYKAILVDANDHLLNVSRYIHLTPVAAGLVKRAEAYPWSSYCSYIGPGRAKSPRWLNVETTLSLIGARSRKRRYEEFVEAGVDSETERFYGGKKQAPILGGDKFIQKMQRRVRSNREIPEQRTLRPRVRMNEIIDLTAREFKSERTRLLHATRGRGNTNVARSAAMYLTRKSAGYPLNEIADCFGLKSYGSVSGQIHRFKETLDSNPQIERKVARLSKMISKKAWRTLQNK